MIFENIRDSFILFARPVADPELSDYSTYQDAGGAFVPRRQFEVFMSVEQLGRRLQGIFAHDRDVATCRALAFDPFDTLKGLAIVDLFEGCKLTRAERVLASLESALPSKVSELLLIEIVPT
jgi:hypothetical protein